MNSIFGRINLNRKLINKSLFNKSIDELCVFSGVKKDFKTNYHCEFGQVIFPPFKIYNDPISEINPKLIIVSDSTLYNKSDILTKLNISNESYSDEFLILKSFEKWGIDCLEYLLGDFSFAIWNSEKEELFCARDHFGIKPFNYFFDDERFVFSSDIRGILTQADLTFSVDERYIADTISIVKSENFRTTYTEIKKLPPAHYLILNQNKIEIKQYWELKPQKTFQQTDVEIIEEFKNLLIESVKCRSTDKNSVGSELSGGIDSSSITAIASQFTNLKTFSHVLPDNLLGKIHPFKDEREFVNLLGNFCNIKNRYFITSEESLINPIKQHVSYFESITQQGFGVFSDQLYQAAMKNEVSVLLSGFGGDEVVTSKSLGYLSELVFHNNWKDVKADLRNKNRNKINYIQSLLKLYFKTKFPFIRKIIALLKLEKPWWFEKYKNLAVNPSFAENMDIKNQYLKYFTKTQTYSLQEKNIERITHPHVSQRLEYCSLIARKHGIEYRYPLLDKRLIEYYLAIPTRLKARNGIGRFIIRKAIEGIVPKEIQWRDDKSGTTIPTVFMRMKNDVKKIQEIINRATLNESIKKYIDLDKYNKWFNKLCKRSEKTQKNINPGAFYNYLKLIIFIEKNPNLFK